MYNLSDINTIKSILSKNGFSFSKALGQNFIIDDSVCPRMADAAVPDEEYGVIEVGPGIGVLTAELAKRAKRVVAIELDDRLPPILADTLSDFDNVKIVSGDVMKIDLHALIKEEFSDMPVVICANLHKRLCWLSYRGNDISLIWNGRGYSRNQRSVRGILCRCRASSTCVYLLLVCS